jgi:hypothetical protein
MARTRVLVSVLLAVAFSSSAQTADPADLIGMDPPAAFTALGPPREIFAWRGVEPAEDNIVFFYPDFRYLFWFANRVWQVRYDNRYAGTVMGFSIGMGRAEAEATGQGRLQESGGSLYLAVDTGRFPVRLRLAMVDGRVADIYVYRSDW